MSLRFRSAAASGQPVLPGLREVRDQRVRQVVLALQARLVLLVLQGLQELVVLRALQGLRVQQVAQEVPVLRVRQAQPALKALHLLCRDRRVRRDQAPPGLLEQHQL